MSMFIIFIIIVILVFFSLKYYRSQNGSCGDCNCSCPIKDKMKDK